MIPARTATVLRLLIQKSPHILRYNSNISCQEIKIPVPWGHVAGKWWGPTNKRPVLTLHGWQDNCGSFNRLIPLLNDDIGFLAIDFPGHGLSSRIPSGLYCYFTNYLLLVRQIVQYFNWPQVSLLGHSMGAITSYCYTMIFPKEVDFLICIDAAKPMIMRRNIEKMAKNIDNFLIYDEYERDNTNEPPSYTMEEIKRRVCAPNNNSVKYEYSNHLIERNVAPSKLHPNKYYFTRDPRIKVGELMNWPQEESVAASKFITCPILIGKAIDGSYYEVKENFYEVLDVLRKSSRHCQYERIDGTHHYHLNNPEEFARIAKNFIRKHNIEDRSIGGIKPEMLTM